MPEYLHRLEDLLKVERIAMQDSLRHLASKVGTPTFGAEFFRPYIEPRDVPPAARRAAVSAYDTDYQPVAVRLEGRCFDPIAAPWGASRQSKVADFSRRNRSANSRIVKLTCCMITARWFAALLPDRHRPTPRRLSQYARVIESHGSPFPKLVGFLDGSRNAISDHPEKGVQNSCLSAKYKSNLAYQRVVGPDGIVLEFTGPFGGLEGGRKHLHRVHAASTYSCYPP
jgi:hypothetical protein